MQNKPELLLPVGNIESFHAAIRGGADAIYLGLKKFNARGRASNFTTFQLQAILEIAKQNNVKVYITLNIVIKNKELPQLIDYLHFLNEAGVDGIIIQDWGVYQLAKSFFPKLEIHASTQLGLHNSLGAIHSKKLGFTRVVLARELTLHELESICKNSQIETEVFIHGALCYSFSGMCLFSSYSGGWGANRGVCAQPCRRNYKVNNKQQFLFNLKDNQQILRINNLKDFGVSSLKIEGRMKSGEYTYRVATAYRLAIDNPTKIKDAQKMLELDFGRQKTGYFFGGNVENAISETTVTGIKLGKVVKTEKNAVLVSSNMELKIGYRVRFQFDNNNVRETVKIKELKKVNDLFWIGTGNKTIKKGSEIYLSGLNDVKFSSKLKEIKTKRIPPLNNGFKRKILKSIRPNSRTNNKAEVIFRINSLEWLRKINFNDIDGLYISLSKTLWKRFNPELPFIQKNKTKIYIELPRFIAENSIPFYENLCKKMGESGLVNVVISHLSQKLILPQNSRVFTNENVYVFNDAAAKLIKQEGVSGFTYPQEIDFETLQSLSDKSGLVPVYFYPELFFSRMPVKSGSEENRFTDDKNLELRKFRRNGITSVVPTQPVSFLQFKNKLSKSGFSRFLIDLSYETVSKNKVKTLKKRLLQSGQVQPSTTFNFSKELK